jgi:hypothetical protein
LTIRGAFAHALPRGLLCAGVTGLLVLTALVSADAGRAAVTIGPTDTAAPPNGLTGCGADPCTFTNLSATGLTLTAPFDGVIVRWRIRTANATATWRLRTLRQTTFDFPELFTGGAASDEEQVVPGGERTFETRIPIASGDLIGVDGPASATAPLAFRSISGASNRRVNPPLDEGESRSATGFGGGFVGLFNADVEPDCDSDGFGDETQDPSLFGGNCPIRGRILTLDANKNKVKKGKTVILSGLVTELTRQGECQAVQTVDLQRKKPSQSTFTTVEQLQTDTGGNFSTKRKVKKTFEYRAQVPETATCAGQTSNTEKVKVRKK